tara:strand:- start:1502 stop:1786 length:285 start_codon:yes stop_codon:yes gene_type:complete
MKDILVTGLATLDLILKMVSPHVQNKKYIVILLFFGGVTAVNASTAVARLGANSTIFSAAERKEVGTLILGELNRENVNSEFVLKSEIWQPSCN